MQCCRFCEFSVGEKRELDAKQSVLFQPIQLGGLRAFHHSNKFYDITKPIFC